LPEDEDQPSNLTDTFAKVRGLLARRRWWILVPFFVITLASIVGLLLLPNRYTSSATLLVVQQQVPQRYVVPNSTTDVASALQAMKQEVLSRTQLLRMINDFGLYPKQRLRLPPEELVSMMLSNIDIMPINENPQQKDIDAFRISFTTENAVVAQHVTNTLTSLFINEYLRTSAEQASNTTNFLHERVLDKGREVEAQEERLRDFKLRYVGELPEQQQGNLSILSGMQNQLQNVMASRNRAEQQRALLQAQLEATPKRSPASDFAVSTPHLANLNSTQMLTPVEAAQNELARLQAVKLNLQMKGYSSQHPDVTRNLREIAQAQETLRNVRASAPPPAPVAQQPSASRSPSEIIDDPAVAQIKTNIEASRLEINNLWNEEKRLKGLISQYENRINQTPVREQQQASILRDTEVLRQQYSELQKKEQESQLATNLEKQQGGKQFRLIDPASLPAVPSSPKRLKLSLAATLGGFVFGLLLALAMELKDTSFHTEEDLLRHIEPPFVLGLPVLPTPGEIRRRKWMSLFQWAAASTMALVVLAAEFYIYKRG
jgi:succinoglycan biosynthesis transport protein ExoP